MEVRSVEAVFWAMINYYMLYTAIMSTDSRFSPRKVTWGPKVAPENLFRGQYFRKGVNILKLTEEGYNVWQNDYYWSSTPRNVVAIKVAEHSFQEPMPNSP